MTEIFLACGHTAVITPNLESHRLLICMTCCTAQPFVTAGQVSDASSASH